jgi:DNA-binding NarL/FixJ family response regulator
MSDRSGSDAWLRGVLESVDREPLTARQTAIVARAAHGISDKQIARDLGISYRTVRTHWERMFTKWETHSRVAIVAIQFGSCEPLDS